MIDYELRQEIVHTVNAARKNAVEGEQYVSGKRLCEMFQMFTPSWLKQFGHLLNRVNAQVLMPDGSMVKTGYAYPVAEIRRMIDENALVFDFKPKVEYRASKKRKKK